MRLVAVAVAFLVGVVAGQNTGIAPEGSVPPVALWAAIASAVGLIAATVVARRNPITPMIALVALIGFWRGTTVFGIETDASTTVLSSLRWDAIDSLRAAIESTLNDLLTGDHGGLSTALLTGERSGISSQTVDNFRAAGLAHLLAISGLHVALVGGIMLNASAAVGGKRGGWYLIPAFVAVILYAALSGFAPPVTRAVIMFAVFILARFTGRGTLMLPTIALAGIVMVAIDPTLIQSLSFQLSFAAVAGIATVAPNLNALSEVGDPGERQDREERRQHNSLLKRAGRFARGSIVVSIAATVATAPIVGLSFGAIPVWGVLATLLALPAIPVVIVSSAVAAAVGSLDSSVIAPLIAFPVWLSTSFVITVAAWFASLPASSITSVNWTPELAIAYYVVVGTVLLMFPRIRNAISKRFTSDGTTGPFATAKTVLTSQNPLWLAGVLAVLAGTMFIAASAESSSPSRYLDITFLSVESGEATLITTPHGNRVLIDAGVNETEVAGMVATELGPFERDIDLVILTHPDADHVGGMPEVLRRFDVETVLHTGESSNTLAFNQWKDALQSVEATSTLEPGSIFAIDTDVFVHVISAGCETGIGTCNVLNDTSAVMRVVYRDISILLTGDIGTQVERRLVRRQLPLASTILKVAHHGSTTSSAPEFLAAASPDVAVFTVGYGEQSDRFGHPDPVIYRRVASFVPEQRIYRTDTQGTVSFTTDGTRLWRNR